MHCDVYRVIGLYIYLKLETIHLLRIKDQFSMRQYKFASFMQVNCWSCIPLSHYEISRFLITEKFIVMAPLRQSRVSLRKVPSTPRSVHEVIAFLVSGRRCSLEQCVATVSRSVRLSTSVSCNATESKIKLVSSETSRS